MDVGGRALNPLYGWLILGFFVGFFCALLFWRIMSGRRQKGYLAIAEYWVYVRKPKVPQTELLMTRMISDNPHNRPGKACITNREGLLFTDVRLHVAAVLKEKNPHVFRPDLFEKHVVPTTEILALLAEAEGMIKVRYVSEVPLKDTRHLQFIPHMADAVSDLCEGLVVFDNVQDELYLASDFRKRLSDNGNAERPEFHLRVIWEKLERGCIATTKGLMKVGLNEWRSEVLECDLEVLATGLMMSSSNKVFRKPDDIGPYTMEAYGDTFELKLLPKFHEGSQLVSLTRRASS